MNDRLYNQTEIFEKTFTASIGALKDRATNQIQRFSAKQTDIDFLSESERKYIEGNLEKMETSNQRHKEELAALQKAEVRAAKCDRIREARQNLNILIFLEEKGVDVEDDIEKCLSILREVDSIGEDDLKKDQDTSVDIESLFHLGEKDIKKAFRETNVMQFVREASQHGWNINIDKNEITLTKDGVEVAEVGTDFVCVEDHYVTAAERTTDGKNFKPIKE